MSAAPDFSDPGHARWQDEGDNALGSIWSFPMQAGPAADGWGAFRPEVAARLIRRYTKPGGVVLDPFVGSGTTLLACRRLGRHGVGVELDQRAAEVAHARAWSMPGPVGVRLCLTIGDAQADATWADVGRQLGDLLNRRDVDLVILHPPYQDLLRPSDDPRDLAHAKTSEAFQAGFRAVAERAFGLLQPGGFVALVIGDRYRRGALVPLGFACMETIRSLGTDLLAINVTDRPGHAQGTGRRMELWAYRARRFGFSRIEHDYVMVFRKPRHPKRARTPKQEG